MATKFASIYKQELKSKGALSSMGSAVLKSARERTDIRNMLFGGKGMLSATGQKMFGRGYSALSSGATGAPSAAQAAAQSSATSDLLSSSERQEALLRVVAKNTFNMNMMARDMNITRQNIATLTRLAAGQSAKSQDAMWYDVKTRNQAIDSLGKKTPTKAGGSTESKGSGIFGILGGLFSGGANLLGAVVSGLLGTVGTIGGGILSTIGSVLKFIPGGFLIGTIALAGVAYLIKKVSENVDFSKLKNDILKGLGLDPDDKENSLTKQILMKLGFSEGTAGKIDKTFTDIGQTFSNIFEPVVRTMLVHSKAAFNTLAYSFSILGEEFKYQVDKLFGENKGKIFAAITIGLMGPAALLSPKLALGIAGLAAGFGYLTRNKTVEELQAESKEEKRIQNMDLGDLIPGGPGGRLDRDGYGPQARANKLKEIMGKWERGEKLSFKEEAIVKAELKTMELQAQIEAMNRAETASQSRRSQLQNLGQTVQEKYLEEVQRENLNYLQNQALNKPGEEALAATPGQSSTAPSRLSIGQRVGDYRISSLFGKRTNPFTGQGQEDHNGIDIAMPRGTPLYAIVDGKIVAVGNNPVAGNFVTLRDSKGTEYSYSHLDSSDVTVGQEVKRGNLIGKSGNTGRSTAPHLHFGVKEQGKFREPVLEELRNAVTQAQKVSALSIENMEQRMALASPAGDGGTTIIAPQNTTVASGGASQGFAGAIDAEAVYLFIG
jgi:murein DD-endopeptidase MepM/ murein hydrolase activator NlpD